MTPWNSNNQICNTSTSIINIFCYFFGPCGMPESNDLDLTLWDQVPTVGGGPADFHTRHPADNYCTVWFPLISGQWFVPQWFSSVSYHTRVLAIGILCCAVDIHTDIVSNAISNKSSLNHKWDHSHLWLPVVFHNINNSPHCHELHRVVSCITLSRFCDTFLTHIG